jgi:hypothetical protein
MDFVTNKITHTFNSPEGYLLAQKKFILYRSFYLTSCWSLGYNIIDSGRSLVKRLCLAAGFSSRKIVLIRYTCSMCFIIVSTSFTGMCTLRASSFLKRSYENAQEYYCGESMRQEKQKRGPFASGRQQKFQKNENFWIF